MDFRHPDRGRALTIREQVEAWGGLLEGEVEGNYNAVLFLNYNPFRGDIGTSLGGRGSTEVAALSNLLIKVREVAWKQCLTIEDLHNGK